MEPLHFSPTSEPMIEETECFHCGQKGTTTLLLTKIPFFREIMVSRFECPFCYHSDNAIQFAGEYPTKGVHFVFHASQPEHLNRRVVKSKFSVVTIPQIGFEIPSKSQPDLITTIEGILTRAYSGLSELNDPKLGDFLSKLNQLIEGEPFDLILDDYSGNSFIENVLAPASDPCIEVSFYKRTDEQTESLGLMVAPQSKNIELDDEKVFVSSFPSQMSHVPCECPVCSTPGENLSCTLDIPFFKELIIMSFNCEQCSYRHSEVMVGGSMSPVGHKIVLQADNPADLTRELLKSDLARIEVPEAGVELLPGTLGGKFTTVEGILNDIATSLSERNPFASGDSSTGGAQKKIQEVVEKLHKMSKMEIPFTLILDDPLANSFIQKFDESDPKPIVQEYQRTEAENESLGINDIKTEGYESTN